MIVRTARGRTGPIRPVRLRPHWRAAKSHRRRDEKLRSRLPHPLLQNDADLAFVRFRSATSSRSVLVPDAQNHALQLVVAVCAEAGARHAEVDQRFADVERRVTGGFDLDRPLLGCRTRCSRWRSSRSYPSYPSYPSYLTCCLSTPRRPAHPPVPFTGPNG